jgi:hypothetical protein
MYSQRQARERARAEGRDWFHTAHSSDWQEIRLIGDTPTPVELVASPHSNSTAVVDRTVDQSALPITRGIMQSGGLVWQHLKASRLPAGGWLYPHRDRNQEHDTRLNYVWIPLHDASPNLKLYPYGYMPNRVGQMYLLNNSSHTHSVWNRDTRARTVLLGRFDLVHSQLDMTQIKKAVEQQWYS